MKSLAAVFHGEQGHLSLEEIAVPDPAGSEVLVRIHGCTLCGSDLHTHDGRRTVPVPTILGHEITGEIAAFGPDARHEDFTGQALRIGTRVTWAIVAHCGDCFFCRRGLPQKCLRAVKYGHEKLQPGHELRGGLAEYCQLAPGTSIIALPDELPLSAACPANCATATVAAAVDAAGVIEDRVVTVHGAGLLGLTAVAMCRAQGAAEVIAVDVREQRLEKALEFGATRATVPAELDAAVKEATGGFGVDVSIELSGQPAGFEDGWKSLRTGGTLVAIGAVFPSPAVPLLVEQLVRRCLTIRGVHNYGPDHLATAVKFLTAHHQRLGLGDLVHEWFPLRDVERAFSAASCSESIRLGVRCSE